MLENRKICKKAVIIGLFVIEKSFSMSRVRRKVRYLFGGNCVF